MSVIIFDMDGVIIDSEGVYLERLKEFLAYKGYSVAESDLLDLVGSNTKRDKVKLRELIGSTFDYENFEKERREYFKNRPIDFGKLFMPNVLETITELKNNGHSLSLASSSPLRHIHKILDLLGVSDCFDYVISGEDFKESKPNPEIYIYTRNKYPSTKIDEIYVVEDSTLGITAAKEAGLKVIAKNDNRYHFDQSSADYHIDDLLEIISIVA